MLLLDGWHFTALKIILIAIYSFVLIAYSNKGIEEGIRENIQWGDLLMDNPMLIILIAASTTIIYQILYKFLEVKSISKHDKSEFSTSLLVALERPVNKKRERFAEQVEIFLRSKTTTYGISKIFKAITKPNEQKKLILESLEVFLKNTYKDIDFKVGLMSIKNDEIDDWSYYLPINRQPRTSIEDLKRKESTISRCIKSKHTEIVEDVRTEMLRRERGCPEEDIRYIKGGSDDTENGSLICYPIISITTRKLIYVISVVASEKKFFESSEKKYFEWVLERFAIRLALEHSLECLRDNKL